jgi:hypothetical protein
MGPSEDVMLLTTLKFAAFIWLTVLVAGTVGLAALYLLELLVRVSRQSFGARR